MKALSILAASALLASAASAQGIYLNEIYASHSGTDDQEMIELVGPPGASLDGIVVGIVEGDAGSSCAACLDAAWDLSGMTIGASGYFVLGDTAVTPKDLDIGASNTIENGTETFYLISTSNPAAITALVGTTVDNGGGTTILPTMGTILDLVGMTDGGATDQVFDGAPVRGPDGTFFPAGIFRCGDWPGDWSSLFLDFDDVANANQPRTPGAMNVDVGCEPGTAYCNGDGSGTPCPAGNNNDGSLGVAGCANTNNGGGGTLRATGSTATSVDLVAGNVQPGQPGLFFQADNAINGGLGNPFGDGLRCAGGSVVRLGVVPADANGDAVLASIPNPGPGVTKRYQYWYRNPGITFGAGFNLTNGYEITW